MGLLDDLVTASAKVARPLVSGYAAGNRTLEVVITRPGGKASFDRTTGAYRAPEEPVIYTGRARVRPIAGSTTVTAEDEIATISQIALSIDDTVTVPPRLEDVITFPDVAANEVAHVAGRVFTVTDVEVGGFYGYGWQLTGSGVAPSRRT